MQPTHCTSDMPWAEARLGKERIKGAYAWRSLLDSGAVIASGSDFPVEEVPVLHGIYSAVTRQDRRAQPPEGWYPAQRMTLEEALESFTSAAAYAGFADKSLGKLQKGYLADITVYDRKLEADLSLHRTRVNMTIVGGQVVFERK
jgi:predicted amidohydrolase YtcJ